MKIKHFGALFAALLSLGLVTACAEPSGDVDADPGADVVEPDAGVEEPAAEPVEPEAGE